jgi:hypothetical protein
MFVFLPEPGLNPWFKVLGIWSLSIKTMVLLAITGYPGRECAMLTTNHRLKDCTG